MKFWNWVKNLFKPSMFRKLSSREIRQLDRAVKNRPTVEEYLKEDRSTK